MRRAIATLAILRPRRFAIRSKAERSGPPPVAAFCAASTKAQRMCGEPCREMWPGRAEAFDLADLGNYEHGGVGADPAQLAEDVDARVVACESVDLTLREFDLAVEIADQAEQTV